MNKWGFLLVTLLFTLPINAAERIAWVVGNNAYQGAPLRNSINDARAIGTAFQRMGFSVIRSENANSQAMSQALDRFGKQAEKAKIAVIFYAGHGIQIGGKNYLLPTNIIPKRQGDLRKLISLNDMMNEASLASQLGVVILDACRDNPFGNNLKAANGRSIAGRGLARVQNTASNVLVAFATSEGKIAADGRGKHSPFTTALLASINKPKDIRKVLGQVRDDVKRNTRQQQIPFTYGSLGGGNYCLTQRCSNAGGGISQEDRFWTSTEKCGKASCYQAYLKRYPRGRYVGLARGQVGASVVIRKPVDNSSPRKPTPSRTSHLSRLVEAERKAELQKIVNEINKF